MMKKELMLAISVAVILGIGLMMGFAHDAQSQTIKKVVIDNKNGPKPLHFGMAVKEIDVKGQAISDLNTPLTLKVGQNATYKIAIESKETIPLSLGLKVFNNDDKYARDLAMSHAQSKGDASGLPSGITASLGKNIATVSANGNDQEILTVTIDQNAKPGKYMIGVLAIGMIGSVDGIEIDNGQILDVPITIQ